MASPFQAQGPTNPKECDALDLREVWRASYASYGPSWDAAIEMGIDIAQLEYNLTLSPTERLLQHEQMMRTFELLHNGALTKER